MKRFKRVMALMFCIVIVGLIVATFIVACLGYNGLFKRLLVCDVIVPVLGWAYMMIYKVATMADERLLEKAQRIAESEDEQ